MDDKEYYTMMNKMPSSKLYEHILKENQKRNKNNNKNQLQNNQKNSFNHLESRQGRDDAEMLMENQRG